MKISLQPIMPKKDLFNPARYKDGIELATFVAKEGIKADFRKTAATWSHQPKWYTTRRGTDWYIGTTDEIYGYVNYGTRPHIIAPKKKGGRLSFRSGYKAKSRVGYIDSYAGSPAHGATIWAKIVHHPGTKARQFSIKIKEKWMKEFAKMCRQAIKTAAS